MATPPDLIVFSHLRWDFVYQRPQHVLSRLASRRRVVFIEEPVQSKDGSPRWEKLEPHPGVLVCRPHTLSATPGFHDEQIEAMRPLVRQLVTEEGLQNHIAWFYSPLAYPLVDEIQPLATVYDCMDELSAFLHAPKELLRREADLLADADVVFTGGPSLYKAKRGRSGNVHCFPSSVDAKHFGMAKTACEEPADQASIPHPRLGFFGVIDERLDPSLLDAVAAAHPDWHIVMIGPVVKIDPATLPRRPNIHYLGARTYRELPLYLAGWDVCLLPFARNDSTKFISPTKTLEYMAAERPIVSTPITDVAEPYGDVVFLGDTPESFIGACEQALAIPDEVRARQVARMRELLSQTSWDRTADAMDRLLDEAVERNAVGSRASGDLDISDPAYETKGNGMDESIVIVGAGPTGLSAAYHLGEDAVLFERENRVGGWCRSIEVDGFTFDYAGHIMFSNDPYVHELYKMLLGDNVHWQDREAWVYSKGVHTRYPFQGALYGLPPQVIKECVMGAIEARYGSSKSGEAAASNGSNGSATNGHASNGKNGHAVANGANAFKATNGNGSTSNGHAATCVAERLKDCCADGILEETAPLVHANGNGGTNANGAAKPQSENFEQFIYRVWGAGIAKHFAIPYNRKLWAVPLTEMETSWLGGRVPMPDLEEMIEGALKPVPKPMGPNARFGYPLKGGFQALMDGFVPHLGDRVHLGVGVVSVSPSQRTVTLSDGTERSYSCLISTMPLPVLIRSMGDEAPADVQKAAQGLRNVSVRCVHIGVGRENLTEKHWIYYPEETVFHRIFVQGNASPHCNPKGGFGLTCEITYSPSKPLPCEGEALVQRCIEDCKSVGLIREDDPILVGIECDLPHAYVVYDHARARNVALIRSWLETQNIILAGRYSEWEYYNSDHAFIAGKKAAESARKMTGALVAAV